MIIIVPKGNENLYGNKFRILLAEQVKPIKNSKVYATENKTEYLLINLMTFVLHG